MCDPVSLTLAATAATMAGQFVQGQSAYTSAKYQESAATANAGYAATQAKQSNDLTEQEAQRRYRDAAQLGGEQQAAMAANGVDINYGTPAGTMADTKTIANEDVSNIYTSGERRTEGYLVNAYNYREQAAAARSQASSAGLATGIGMFGTALGAASQINHMSAMKSMYGNAYGPSGNFGG